MAEELCAIFPLDKNLHHLKKNQFYLKNKAPQKSLIISWAAITINDLIDSLWHASDQVLEHIHLHAFECFSYDQLQLLSGRKLPVVGIHSANHYSPEILHRIEVRRTCRPMQGSDISGSKPPTDAATSMDRGVILLENEWSVLDLSP
jgi:hypothetical protein